MPNMLVFDGRLAKAATLTRHADTVVGKFTLIRNEYAGSEREERKVAVSFVAFGKTAEAIAEHTYEGDQLVIEARLENNNYTDKDQKEVYGFNFVVSGFDFGAPGKLKREHLSKQQKAAA